MNEYRVGDIVAAFFAGALLIALIIRGIERKLIVVEEVTATEQTGREHDSESDTRPSPQNIRITPKAANA